MWRAPNDGALQVAIPRVFVLRFASSSWILTASWHNSHVDVRIFPHFGDDLLHLSLQSCRRWSYLSCPLYNAFVKKWDDYPQVVSFMETSAQPTETFSILKTPSGSVSLANLSVPEGLHLWHQCLWPCRALVTCHAAARWCA